MEHLRTSQVSPEELKEILAADKLERTRDKHTNFLLRDDLTPEEVLLCKIELVITCIMQLSEALVEYRSFEHHSPTITLAIIAVQRQTEQQIAQYKKELNELLEDALIMSVLTEVL